jgi:hypothetical protein
MFYFVLFLLLQVVLFGAWVSGALDPYQKKLQELLLEVMGETKASYGLKSMYCIAGMLFILQNGHKGKRSD